MMLNADDEAIWKAYTQTVQPLKKISGVNKIKFLFSPRCWFLHKKEPLIATVLDLHGMTLDEAYHIFNRFLQMHFEQQTSQITVITGKGKEGKGLLKKEFPSWLEVSGIKEKISEFHLQNEGSFRLKLRKKKC